LDFDFTTDAGQAFLERNPKFGPAFERLMVAGNKCFGRQIKPKNQLENVCFGLGHTCREDYLGILLLALDGYGHGASQLFRSLYERAVTLAYIIKFPEKAEPFVRYGAIQEHRAMEAALKIVSVEDFDKATGKDNTVALIRQRYREIKPEFQMTQCSTCKTTRTMPSFDVDFATMVQRVGPPLSNIFVMGYAIPNLHIHATLASAMSDFDKEDQNLEKRVERKRDEREFVLALASATLIQVMRSHSGLYSLGLESELDVCDQDVVDLWVPQSGRTSAP